MLFIQVHFSVRYLKRRVCIIFSYNVAFAICHCLGSAFPKGSNCEASPCTFAREVQGDVLCGGGKGAQTVMYPEPSRTLSLPGNAGMRDPLCSSHLGNTTVPSPLLPQESSLAVGTPKPPQPVTQLGAAVGVVCLAVPGSPHPLGQLLVALGTRASRLPQCQVATQSPHHYSNSSRTKPPAGTPPHQSGRWLWHSCSGPMLSLSPESPLQRCAAPYAQIQPQSSLIQCLWKGLIPSPPPACLLQLSPPGRDKTTQTMSQATKSCHCIHCLLPGPALCPLKDVSGKVLAMPDPSLEWWDLGSQVSPPTGLVKGASGSGKDTLRAPAVNHGPWVFTFLMGRFGAPGERKKGGFSQNPARWALVLWRPSWGTPCDG
ncbi:uncharacterized protein M8220_012305 isoform 1-T1 [Acridotheres tristis]